MPEEVITDTQAPEVETPAPVVENTPAVTGIETISEEYRADPNISKYKNLDELAKAHLETVKLIGRKGVILPTEKSTPQEKDAYFKAIGRPDKAEEYKATLPEGLHEKIVASPEGMAAFQSAAHKLGLTQSQFDGLNQWYLKTISDGLTKQDGMFEEQKKTAETRLRNEWGQEFNQNISLAKRVALKFGGKDAVEALGDLGNNPAALRLLANVGKKLSEDSINRGEVSSLTGTPQDAQAKTKAIMADPKHPYHNPNDPGHSQAVDEVRRLYQIAYPSEGES